MASFRYDTSGRWFRGNTHMHTTVSDGGSNAQELWAAYAALGYDFLFHTDHGLPSAFQRAGGGADAAPLLVFDGVEINGDNYGGSTYHVVCLGRLEGITPQTPFMTALESARRQGALLILAHPHWTGNRIGDALRYGFDGVEVYNHVCWWLNGKGVAEYHWDRMLGARPGVLGFASDDLHRWPIHAGGGWIMVNAKDRSHEAILESIRRGNFYSTQGPRFETIELTGGSVKFRTSPIRAAHLVGPRWNGLIRHADPGQTFTDHAWELPKDWPWMRLRIQDEQGRIAWTNPLWGS